MGKDLLQGFVRCVNISKDYVNIRIMGIEAKFALEWFWFWAYMEWRKTWRLLKNGATEDIRLIPAVIGGDEKSRHGVVLAKSNIAKQFGIKTGETIYQANQSMY